MANLRDYPGILAENKSFRHGALRNASRILEGLPRELPLEPHETRWEKREKFLKVRFEFDKRNLLKDFVSSIQELEDRANFFCRMIIDSDSVTIKTHIDDDGAVNDTSEKFLLKVREIYDGIIND